MENAQVAVWLTYAGLGGHALIDTGGCICRARGPATRPAAWAAGDEVYGADPWGPAGISSRCGR